MSFKLPIGEYKLIDNLTIEDIMNYNDNSDYGYTV